MDELEIKKLERFERLIPGLIIVTIVTIISLWVSLFGDIINQNNINTINGHYTITYIKDGVKCKYKTNKIKFHDGDNVITFRDVVSGNEIILNHYVIEVEDE